MKNSRIRLDPQTGILSPFGIKIFQGVSLIYNSVFQMGAREAGQMLHLYPFLGHFCHLPKVTYSTIPQDAVIISHIGIGGI